MTRKDIQCPHRSVAVLLVNSSPCSMSVDVHCRNAQPVGQACRQLLLQAAGTHAIHPPCRMSLSNRCPRLVTSVEDRVAQHRSLQSRTHWLLVVTHAMSGAYRRLRIQESRGEISRMLCFLVVDPRRSLPETLRLQATVASPLLPEMVPDGLARHEIAAADDSLLRAAISTVPADHPRRSHCEGGGLAAAAVRRLRAEEGPRRHQTCRDLVAPKRGRMRCSSEISAPKTSKRMAVLCLHSQRDHLSRNLLRWVMKREGAARCHLLLLPLANHPNRHLP